MSAEPGTMSADSRPSALQRLSSFVLRPSSFLLAAPLAVYVALALPQLTLPGLHNDEAVEAGLQAMQILRGQPITAFRGVGLEIGGRVLPLMVQDYIGAFNVYFSLPFFAAFGPTVAALRLYTVLIGAGTLALTFGFLTDTVSKRAAFIAAMLLAASPSFIFWQRQGVYVASLTATFAVGALWAGAAWAKRGGWPRAAALGLLCGAGLYAKLLFIWIIGGMIGALAIINAPVLISNFQSQTSNSVFRIPHSVFPRTPSLPDLLAFALAPLLALAPLIAFNLQTGGTLLSVGANLTTSFYGVNNLDFAKNLAARVDHFRAVIAGRDHLWYLGGSFGNGLWEPALGLSAIVILGRWLFRRQRSRLPVAILLLLALGLAQSSFTVSGLFPTHFAIFTPLWPILIALAAEPIFTRPTTPNLSGRLGFINVGIVAVGFGLGILLAGDVMTTMQYHTALKESGGLGPHSDAVYRLIDWLNENAPDGAPIIAMDWGFAPQTRMLSSGELDPQEIFGYSWEADEGFAERLNAALDQPGALFIFHFPQETLFPRRQQFDAAVRERRWQVEQLAIISRRDGAPMFEVVRVHGSR